MELMATGLKPGNDRTGKQESIAETGQNKDLKTKTLMTNEARSASAAARLSRKNLSRRTPVAAITLLGAVIIVVGCHSVPRAVRHDLRVESWIAEIKEDEDRWMNQMPRVAGYNEGVWFGEIESMDRSPFVGSTEAKALSLTKGRVIYSEHSEHRIPGFVFFQDTFKDQAPPKAGEKWVIYGAANAKAIWYIHGAFRVDSFNQERILEK